VGGGIGGGLAEAGHAFVGVHLNQHADLASAAAEGPHFVFSVRHGDGGGLDGGDAHQDTTVNSRGLLVSRRAPVSVTRTVSETTCPGTHDIRWNVMPGSIRTSPPGRMPSTSPPPTQLGGKPMPTRYPQ